MSEDLDTVEHQQSDTVEGGREGSLWLASLALVGVSFAIAILFMTLRYDTNDDIAFMWTADGTLYGAPAANLPFQSAAISYALAFCYRCVPALPWYGLYLLSANALAWLLISRAILGARRRWLGLALYASLFSIFGLPLLVRLQFTSAAVLLGLGAIAYFMAMRREGGGPASAIVAGLVLALAGMMRPHEALAAPLVFGGLCLLYDLARWRRIRTTFIFAAAAIALYGASLTLDVLVRKRDPRWTRWAQLQAASHTILTLDLNLTRGLAADLKKLGWSLNDVELVDSLFRTDHPMYGPETFPEVASIVRREAHPIKLRRIRKKLRYRLLEDFRPELLAYLAGLLLLLHLGDLRGLAALAGYSFVCLHMVSAIAYAFDDMPNRVLQPLTLAPALILIAALRLEPAAFTRRPLELARRWAIAPAILAAVIASTWSWVEEGRSAAERRASRQRIHKDFAALHTMDPEGLFVVCAVIGLDGLSPFGARDPKTPEVLFTGWPIETPEWNDRLAKLGIKDLGAALVSRPHLYLIGPDYFRRCLKIYMREHYQLEVEVEKRLTLSRDNTYVFKLVKKQP